MSSLVDALGYDPQTPGASVPPPFTPIDERDQQRGGDPLVLRDELVHVIREWLGNRPRSLQRVVGPSGLGTPCARRLGYVLSGVEHRDGRPPGWLPGIGVAVHSMLETAFVEWNERTGYERFLVETRVDIGTVGGQLVRGTCDLYDQTTATVVDWKIVGKTTLDSARRHGMSQTYRVQAHCYGLGFARLGLPVDTVAICYLPRNNELTGTQFIHEPYDESIALDAISRADAIATALGLVGPEAILPQLDTADDCKFCPYYNVAPANPLEGCAGVATRKLTLAEQLVAGS